ncbi:MAG: hypothetical protein E7505_07320 [Ruminococcus sp.]|nr:hypothetical protein [Ruminococcus sp.]
MKKTMSEDELENAMRLLFNSEVPEEKQFTPDVNREVKVHVVQGERSFFRRIPTISVCAASVLLVISFAGRMYYTEGNMDDFSRVCRDILERTEQCEKIYSFGEEKYGNECFRAAGLMPDESYDLSTAEVYVYTVSDGKRKIYTEEAYVLWYDNDGKISAYMTSRGSVPDEFSESIDKVDIFKGEHSALSGVRDVESAFQNRMGDVVYEGKTIRRSLDTYNINEQNVRMDKIYMYSISDGEPEALCIYNISSTIPCRAFENESDIPETSAAINIEGNSTSYSIDFVYECSRRVAIRLTEEDMAKKKIWNEKIERTE